MSKTTHRILGTPHLQGKSDGSLFRIAVCQHFNLWARKPASHGMIPGSELIASFPQTNRKVNGLLPQNHFELAQKSPQGICHSIISSTRRILDYVSWAGAEASASSSRPPFLNSFEDQHWRRPHGLNDAILSDKSGELTQKSPLEKSHSTNHFPLSKIQVWAWSITLARSSRSSRPKPSVDFHCSPSL